MPDGDDDDLSFLRANQESKGAFGAATGGAPEAAAGPPPPENEAPLDPFMGPPAPEPFVGPPAPEPFAGPPPPEPFAGPPVTEAGAGPSASLPAAGPPAPSTAHQASDWAAGPQPAASPPVAAKDYNASIVGNATTYEKRQGTEIPYLIGGDSNAGIDCSHFTGRVMGESDPGYDPQKDYRTTAQLKAYLGSSPPADGMYEKVAPGDVKPGDLVLFPGHVGIVTEGIDPATGKGSFIGSQNSSGVEETTFGPKSLYWGQSQKPVSGYLRYKGKGQGKSDSATKGAGAQGKGGAGAGGADKNKATTAKPEAKKVTNNNKEIAHEKSSHSATTVQPTDVHLPVDKKGSPQPFMNFQLTSFLKNPSVMTFIEKAKIWLKTSLVNPTDPAHPSHNPGIKSGTYKAEAKATTQSKDLKVEGKNVVREGDKTTQNSGNTTGVVKKAPPPAAKAGDGQRSADGKKKCVKLGPNQQFKDAILTASSRTGMPPETIASVIDAEAAKNKGVWDPESANGNAVGMTQFMPGTWTDMATRSGTYLHEQALKEGYVEANAKGKGFHVVAGKESELLALRTDATTAIVTGAEYDMGTYTKHQDKGLLPKDQSADEAARALYTIHHEGEGGAARYVGAAQTTDNTYYESRLATQLGNVKGNSEEKQQAAKDKAAELVKDEKGDGKAAYTKWFEAYKDKKITPSKFRCSDEKVDGDEAPKPEPPPKKTKK